VVVETLSLLHHRLGLASAVRFETESRWFDVEWVDPDIHAEAVRRWALGTPAASFVDQVSFVVMQRRGANTAFAFDDDFERAGFKLF